MKLDFIRSYDVLKEEDAIAYRGLFIIDRQGVIRHQLVNDTPIGRSVDEAIRVLQALQHFEKNGEVCPANWHEGDKAFKTNKKELDAYCSEKC
jgi:peroxiredoxin (alkyl hydroperoxide reductase subunit C)